MLKRSISVHLALMFALSALLIVSVIGILLRGSLHDSLQKQMHNELLFRESLMSPWITARTSADGWSLLANKFTVLTNSEGERVRYWIVSDNPRFSMGGTPPVGVQWSSLQEGFNKVPGASEGACSLFLLVKTIPANGERPELRYVVAIDSTPYMGTLDAFTRTLLIITALGVVIVALLGYVVSRIGLRPVGALSKQARQLAPGDHGQRLNTEALPDELQQLASSFNGVLERQEVAWRQLESFNADVAHELRTPLTNLIGQTQLGLSRRRSHDELEELLGSNLEELERMTSIVNDMLFLSHAHAGEHASQLTQVSLREETLKTAEYVEPSFAEKQLSLDVQGDVTASVTRAFQNYYALLTNARYMRFTLCLTFYYVAAYAFITGSPFVYITYFGVDPQHYGWLFAVNIVGLMAVSMVNRRLVHRYPLEALLRNAVFIAAIAAIVLAVTTGLGVGGITVIVGAVFVFFSMNGIIAATSTACALDAVPNVAGSASALMGALQYGSGIISSLLLALFSDGTPWTMGWIIALFTAASALMALTVQIKK